MLFPGWMGWHSAQSAFALSAGPSVEAITETSVTVSWSLTEGATGQVFYGTTTAYGSSTTKENTYTYSTHVQSLTGLTAGTLYHFKVVSQNAAGVSVESGDATFTTIGELTGTYPTPAAFAYSATNALARPAYLTPSTDANHGTEVVRVTSRVGVRNLYSSVAAWNRDESILMLASPLGNGYEQVLDGQTLAILNADPTSTYISGDWSWSDSDPLTAWQTKTNTIRRLAVSPTGVVTSAFEWTLSQYQAAAGMLVLGGYQGQQAGDYIPLCYRKASGQTGVAVWSISAETIISELDVGVAASPTVIANAALLSWDGQYLMIHFSADGTGSTQGGWVCDPTNISDRYRITTSAAHEDWVQTVGGHNVLVMVAQSATGGGSGYTIGYYDADNAGAWTALTSGTYYGGHVSGRCLSRPGYVYISNSMAFGTTTYAGHQDIFAIELADPPATGGYVEYYAKQHAPDPKLTYNTDPMACASPSGSRVTWGTIWDNSGTEIHGYVAGVDTIL